MVSDWNEPDQQMNDAEESEEWGKEVVQRGFDKQSFNGGGGGIGVKWCPRWQGKEENKMNKKIFCLRVRDVINQFVVFVCELERYI